MTLAAHQCSQSRPRGAKCAKTLRALNIIAGSVQSLRPIDLFVSGQTWRYEVDEYSGGPEAPGDTTFFNTTACATRLTALLLQFLRIAAHLMLTRSGLPDSGQGCGWNTGCRCWLEMVFEFIRHAWLSRLRRRGPPVLTQCCI